LSLLRENGRNAGAEAQLPKETAGGEDREFQLGRTCPKGGTRRGRDRSKNETRKKNTIERRPPWAREKPDRSWLNNFMGEKKHDSKFGRGKKKTTLTFLALGSSRGRNQSDRAKKKKEKNRT